MWNILTLLYLYTFVCWLIPQRIWERCFSNGHNGYRKHCLCIRSPTSHRRGCNTRGLWLPVQREEDNNLRDPLTWMTLLCQSGKSLTEQMGVKLCPEGQVTVSEQRARVICLPYNIFSFWQKEGSENRY